MYRTAVDFFPFVGMQSLSEAALRLRQATVSGGLHIYSLYCSKIDRRIHTSSHISLQHLSPNVCSSSTFDRYHNYGDLDETGGKYRVQLVDGTEISLKEHERFCRYALGERIPGYCCMDGSSEESLEGALQTQTCRTSVYSDIELQNMLVCM